MRTGSLLLREGFAPSGDRLVTTLFFAAIAHALVIAGVSFAGDGTNDGPTPGLEVVLVAEDLPTAERNAKAPYLAQRSQIGAGTTTERRAARSPQSAPDVIGRDGVREARAKGQESALTSSASNIDIAWSGMTGDRQFASPDVQALAGQRAVRPPGEDTADASELTGKRRDELWIAPDTEASTLAPYVDSWRRKVERLGTLNFPAAARGALASGETRNPIVEVSLAANGDLKESKIQRSSGSPQLDQAALQILRLASPFDAFPPELADRVRVLHFAYEWRFEGGKSGD
jgi:protein TonB